MEQPITNKELLTAIRGIVREEIRQPLEGVQTEIMDAMQLFASDVDRRFDRVETRLDRVEQDVTTLKKDVTSIRATMVTKSYLDDKFADALVSEGSLASPSASRVTMMNPFPRRTGRRA